MEGIDLAGIVDSDFQGIKINFVPPCLQVFANFRGAGQPFFSAGRGGAHILVTITYYVFVSTSSHTLLKTTFFDTEASLPDEQSTGGSGSSKN